MEKLQILNIADNSISILPRDSFQNLTNLQEINFARNMLKSVGELIFEPAARISKVSFEGNELSSLPDLGFRTNVEFNLINNTLTCDCQLSDFVRWINEDPDSVTKAQCQ